MMQQPPVTGRRATDRGLSGLGLVMQLVGGLMTAIAAGYLAMVVIALLGGRGASGEGALVLWMLVVMVSSLVRSIAHKHAGDRLLYDGEGTPASALGRYLVIAAIQIAMVCVTLVANGARGEWLVLVILILGAWPLALLLIARPMVDELGGEAPMGVDGGLDGASILLLVFGAIGVGIGGIMLLGWLELPSRGKSGTVGISLLLAFGLLAARSVMHLLAGMRGTAGEDVAQTVDAAERYAGFGVTAGLVATGLFLVMLISEMPSGPPEATMMVMVMGAMVAGMLLVWPAAVRRFVRDRQLRSLAGTPLHARAPDRGLPALGWLLLALGVYTLASGLGSVVIGQDLQAAEGGRDNPMAALGGMLGTMSSKSVWLGIGVAALQVWAGLELIRLTPRLRTAGMAYGAAAGALALYTHLPTLGALTRGSAAVVGNPLGVAAFAMVATSLVIPVATLVLVQRKLTDPDAIADTFS